MRYLAVLASVRTEAEYDHQRVELPAEFNKMSASDVFEKVQIKVRADNLRLIRLELVP